MITLALILSLISAEPCALPALMVRTETVPRTPTEGNWKYAWQNAALAYEQAGKVDEGKAAFEAAAVKDPAHAEALRTAAAKLTTRSCRSP